MRRSEFCSLRSVFFLSLLLALVLLAALEQVALATSLQTCDPSTSSTCLAPVDDDDQQQQQQQQQPTAMAQQHRVVVAGASGSVGHRVVHFTLKHKSVESVTALLRSGPEKNAAFFGLDPENPNDKAIFDNKLKQKIVDFNAPEDVAEVVKGHTAGISCLGVYTADVKDVDDFMDREYKPNLAVARAAAAAGTKRQTKPGFFEPMFVFTKGSIERDLSAVDGFEATTSARPGMILHRDNHYPGLMKHLEDCMNNWKWFATTRFAVETDDIAKALVHSMVKEQDLKLNEILENEDIKLVARAFDAADAK